MVHILPGEDDPDQLLITKYHLNQFGLSVVLASTGRVALGLLATDQYDGVVSDYEMSGMNGIELLHRIRDDKIPVGFILFTRRGREDMEIGHHAIENYAHLSDGGGRPLSTLTISIRSHFLKRYRETHHRHPPARSSRITFTVYGPPIKSLPADEHL